MYGSGAGYFLSAKERYERYLQALHDADLEPYLISEGEYDIREGVRIMSEWMAKGVKPTAVFAGDDVLAIGLINGTLKGNKTVKLEPKLIVRDTTKRYADSNVEA